MLSCYFTWSNFHGILLNLLEFIIFDDNSSSMEFKGIPVNFIVARCARFDLCGGMDYPIGFGDNTDLLWWNDINN